jgi:hypothetical protein
MEAAKTTPETIRDDIGGRRSIARATLGMPISAGNVACGAPRSASARSPCHTPRGASRTVNIPTSTCRMAVVSSRRRDFSPSAAEQKGGSGPRSSSFATRAVRCVQEHPAPAPATQIRGFGITNSRLVCSAMRTSTILLLAALAVPLLAGCPDKDKSSGGPAASTSTTTAAAAAAAKPGAPAGSASAKGGW